MAQENMLGITEGLFGTRPASFQSEFAAALPALKGMSATDIGTAAAFAGGRQLGRGLMQLTGVEDPEMASANRAKAIAAELQQQGVSMQSSQGMRMLAQKLSEAGDFKAAQAAAALAANFEQSEATVGLKQAQTMQKQQEIMNEAQLRQELQALGPNASEEQLLAVVTKYGSPDKVLAVLQSSQNRQAQMAQQRELAQQRMDIQREGLSMRQQLAEEKRTEREEKKRSSAEAAISNADRVIATVDEALPKVGRLTAGAGGAILSAIPGTEARDLERQLDTIKANLGFDRLQQMRDASPTGGALGQVAVQELIALQSTIASLDKTQSPQQLREGLRKIKQSYENWRNTVRRAETGGTQGNVIDFNSLPTGR